MTQLQKVFFSILLLEGFLVLAIWLFGFSSGKKPIVAQKKTIVSNLLLTDYCFSTESRHTRHLSMPEWIAPFQDLPGYHDHFPSSSFFQPRLIVPKASPLKP